MKLGMFRGKWKCVWHWATFCLREMREKGVKKRQPINLIGSFALSGANSLIYHFGLKYKGENVIFFSFWFLVLTVLTSLFSEGIKPIILQSPLIWTDETCSCGAIWNSGLSYYYYLLQETFLITVYPLGPGFFFPKLRQWSCDSMVGVMSPIRISNNIRDCLN